MHTLRARLLLCFSSGLGFRNRQARLARARIYNIYTCVKHLVWSRDVPEGTVGTPPQLVD